MNPTDPMTPVRALIEAAERNKQSLAINYSANQHAVVETAMEALPSLMALLSEHESLTASVVELRKELAEANAWILHMEREP